MNGRAGQYLFRQLRFGASNRPADPERQKMHKKLREMSRDPSVDLWATDEVHFQQYGSSCRMWIPPDSPTAGRSRKTSGAAVCRQRRRHARRHKQWRLDCPPQSGPESYRESVEADVSAHNRYVPSQNEVVATVEAQFNG
jgi:hypothetical protein